MNLRVQLEVARRRRIANELVRQRRELRALHRLLLRLARAVYTHTRTDIAPDAALPEMKRLVNQVRNRKP